MCYHLHFQWKTPTSSQEPWWKLVTLARESGRQDSKAEVRLSYTVKHHTLTHTQTRGQGYAHTQGHTQGHIDIQAYTHTHKNETKLTNKITCPLGSLRNKSQGQELSEMALM